MHVERLSAQDSIRRAVHRDRQPALCDIHERLAEKLRVVASEAATLHELDELRRGDGRVPDRPSERGAERLCHLMVIDRLGTGERQYARWAV